MKEIISWISNLIGNNGLATVVMSVVPLIELKGGIIFARTFFSLLPALGLAYLGSTAVFFLLYFVLKPILNGLKKIKFLSKFAFKLENFFKEKASNAAKKAEKSGGKAKSEKFLKQLAVFIFVAIPLPMTGVWTGTCVAVFLGLSFKDSILPIVIGNLIAGLIISVLVEIFVAVWSIAILDYVLWALFAIAVVILIITIIKLCSKSKTQKKDEK